MRRVSSSVRRLARGVVAAGAALTVALAPAVALPAFAGGATGAGPSVLLRLTFRQGETRRYTLDVDLAARVEGLESLEGLGAAVPAVPQDGESFAAHLRLDTSDTVLAVFPDGSADVRTTLDAWSLTVQGRPQDLPPGVNGLAVRRRMQPDGASTVIGLDGPSGPSGPSGPAGRQAGRRGRLVLRAVSMSWLKPASSTRRAVSGTTLNVAGCSPGDLGVG